MRSPRSGLLCFGARFHYPCLAAALGAAALLWPAIASGQAVSFTQQSPFVVGFEPVVGPGGAVGGVSIDARGVVSRSDVDAAGRLRDARLKALSRIDAELRTPSRMRKVSLRGIQAAIDECRRKKLPVTNELQNLAGLQRIEYVLVYPEQRDIVLAGFAEGWKIDANGNVVGQSTGWPVLQLDDLIVALRTAKNAAEGSGITCSIDPTEEGLKRLQRVLKSRGLESNEATVTRLRESVGPQQITVTGVSPGTHFAHVLVAADYLMKRMAMNLDPTPIADLPSYMDLLQAPSAPVPKGSMPRFWLAPRYEPLLRDEEGLAWQLRGAGVQALSEEGYLAQGGTIARGRESDHSPAKKWADAMTAHYESLSAAAPIFGELRNCMDLAVAAALLTKEGLPELAGCDLSIFLDEKQVAVAEYHVPKTVDSQASLIRKARQWVVSISGGIDVNSWAVLERVELQPELASRRKAAAPAGDGRWWWD